MTHIMLDLETLSTANNAAILSIGAVKFDQQGVTDSFHVGVLPKSCQDLGLHIDGDTFLWWMDDDRAAARVAMNALAAVDLASALVGFSTWCGAGDTYIWGNGVAFDNTILRSAYAAAGMEFPTPFYTDRCYRTVKALALDVPLDRMGTHHSAVDDATTQAYHLIALSRRLGFYL